MSGTRTVLSYAGMVACVGIGYGWWSVLSPGKERTKEMLKNLPESNPVRMEESRQRAAMMMQVLKEAAETSENQERGPGK